MYVSPEKDTMIHPQTWLLYNAFLPCHILAQLQLVRGDEGGHVALKGIYSSFYFFYFI